MIIEINIDPFQGRNMKKPEAVEVAKAGMDEVVIAAYLDLQRYCRQRLKDLFWTPRAVLTPMQLELLLEIVKDDEELMHSNLNPTGAITMRLLENSYNAGYNDFRLNIGYDAADHTCCYSLRGSKKEPIHIEINGNVGKDTAGSSKNIVLSLNGSAKDEFGAWAANSEFTIRGTAGYMCGAGSRSCRFFLYDEDLFRRMIRQTEEEKFYPNTKDIGLYLLDEHGNKTEEYIQDDN
jgi:hypothetical protein